MGIPRVIRHLDASLVCGVVAAAIRPQYLPALREIAGSLRVPLLVQPRFASASYAAFVGAVRELSPDLIVCDSYSMMIRPDVLEIPPMGAINVHGALLPRYRGPNPIQWMICNDEADAGVTIHHMNGGFDTGDIIAQRRVEARFTDTWIDIMHRVATAADSLLADELPKILDGTAERKEQDSQTARTFRRRTPQDGRIEWSESVRAIYNLVRALVHPLPGAFYATNGGTAVLDQYKSIAEVALLKQEMIGGRWRLAGGVAVTVADRSTQDVVAVEVGDEKGSPVGRAELHTIDYTARTALIRSASPETLAPASRFASQELGLTQVVEEVG